MINKKLLKKASIEDDFDEAFGMICEALEIDYEGDSNVNLLPNAPEVRRILRIGKIKYEEYGLWILIREGNKLDFRPYDRENSCYDALNKSDLFPYVAHGITFTEDYLDLSFVK